MLSFLRKIESALFLRLARRQPSGKLEAGSVRLLVLTFASSVLAYFLPHALGALFGILAWCLAALLSLFLLGLLLRWVFARVLWTVRSRLIVTCLLMGLAPIVLFGVLGGIAAYVFCGQFATSIALEGVNDSLARLQERSLATLSQTQPGPAQDARSASAATPGRSSLLVTTWYDGKAAGPATGFKATPFSSAPEPSWLHPGFKGVVVAADRLFLCSGNRTGAGGHTTDLLACTPFGDPEVAAIAEGLGTIDIAENPSMGDHDSDDEDEHRGKKEAEHKFFALEGGKLPAPQNFFDLRIYFSAPLLTYDWTSGESDETWLIVVSRPAVLYRRLFESSVRVGRYVKAALIATGTVFGLIELFAIFMAIALSRTITRSIADLYDATKEIDSGNLEHHIPVRRKDQLAALASSFNSMTSSLKALLIEQREKDRMQSELKIAQEVQNNLFPHTRIALPDFEVYGICEPARTIGGDYYDFIPFAGSQLYLSLGDISGKGISAALLMASLHSAVRAFRSGESETDAKFDSIEETLSPGHLLALLNQHLYSSTQPEKYATLFLACYNASTRLLTYSNGGHLPPLVLCANGELKRLDCGGSVVGLLPGMRYRDETVQLGAGDLLIAYSDGLTEPERDGVEFGEARLIAEIRRHSILPLADIAERTLASVRAWIGDEEQPDDMTIVLARLS